jgi:hypothetical protein
MPKGELRFSRHACFGANAQEVLQAIGHVLKSLAARGFEVPADATVRVRASGFGYAAALLLPERLREGDCYVLSPAVRRTSAIVPRADVDALAPDTRVHGA